MLVSIVVSMMQSIGAVTWYDGSHAVRYTVVGGCSPVVEIALQMFCDDMKAVTGHRAEHFKGRVKDGVSPVEIYQLDKANAKALKALQAMNVLSSKLMEQQDAFFLGVRNGKVIVVGNNGRGAAYGILELSRWAGVSPWIWWGDVVPEKKARLVLADNFQTLQSPSVQYRGIFINDEDWSTLQWANTVFHDSHHGKVRGKDKNKTLPVPPQAYKRIFQLMLRLRANTLWPAMHEVTKAFFAVKGNREMAD
jgi:hypothetical protein